MDKKPFVSVLDLLLRPDLPDVRRELPEKRVEVKRLSCLAGEPVVFRLKALTYDQTRRVQDKPRGGTGGAGRFTGLRGAGLEGQEPAGPGERCDPHRRHQIQADGGGDRRAVY